ncbi:MAG: hypothetical protein Q4G46_15130, partial [Propionibacteriaceae bacterium]|nr:hypothetical protein [Propionibacteriaceae bacterium]
VIPTTQGVSYLINGQAVEAGAHQVSKAESVTVSAVAQPGYVLADGAASTWNYTFRNNNGRN